MADGNDLIEFTSVNVDRGSATELTHLKRRTDNFEEVRNIPNLPHDKDYHMFICYTQDNAEDVRIIVKNLEREGIKCCYHERDFLPGQQVIRNIHDSINRSMSILVVLSEKFVQSGYGKHEIEQALHASIDQEYTIIPIKIEQCDVPKLLKHFTYIDATSVEATERHLKILDAFIWNESNGFTLEFPLSRCETCCRWFSLSRIKFLFDEASRRRIRKHDFEISDELLDEIQTIVSDSVYIKYAHIVNKFTRLTTFVFLLMILLFIVVLITIFQYTLEPTMNKKKVATVGEVFGYGFLSLFILWLCVIIVHNCGSIGNFKRWKGMTRGLKERSRANLKWTLWKKINSKFAESKRLVIIFRDTTVLIMRYDFKPCQDLFMHRCNINESLKKKMLPTESLRAYANRLFRNYMKENIEMLSVKSETFGRHTMENGAKCLCELVEHSILLQENIDP
ncbi:uncharacterized protein LOC128547993 isoform X2 [Mercenaria mercenaria]|uniref:uncharacterized protein LOC128547993 isoform X2 n=1 Tax=Mercenaria mercenaria TaxID=6596 RepID=UPI00234EE3A9|nr:uncharacterized protein LOC128547993 isoform X2 [Mercenaria mercenaria]